MRRGLGFKLIAALLIYANLLPPALLLAQTSKPAGVVSALKGEVVITRVALSQQPIPLRFKDEVFFRDRITTKEQSLVRVLMGGKALITVRELSELTITEEPGKPSLVDLAKGKIGLAVARARMAPGETIEVRTPNAVAAVRGTVIIVEVMPAAAAPGTAGAEPDYQPVRASFTGEAVPVQAPSFITNFHVLKGSIDVTSLAKPGAPPVSIGAGLSVSVTGAGIGQPRPSPPMQQLVRDLKADPQHTGTPEETSKQISQQQEATATTLAKVITGEQPPPSGEEPPPSPVPPEPEALDTTTPPPPPPTQDVVLSTTGCTTDCPGSTTTTTTPPPPTGEPLVTFTGFNGGSITLNAPLALVQSDVVTLAPVPLSFPTTDIPGPSVTIESIGAGGPGEVLMSGSPGIITTPYFATSASGETVSLSGGIGLINTTVDAGFLNIFEVNGASATIGGTALDLTSSSSITNADRVVGLASSLTGTSSAPLLSANSSSIIDASYFADIPGGSTLSLAGPFLSATGSTLSYTNNFIFLGGTLSSTTTQPLISLTSSPLTGTGFDFIEACCGTSPTLTLAGPLLSATGSAITLEDYTLIRFDGGTLTSGMDQPFVLLSSGSSLNNVYRLLEFNCCDTTTANLAGPLLALFTTSTASFNNAVISVSSGSSLTSATASPFIGLDSSTLTSFALLENNGTVILGGPLFAASNDSTAMATEFAVRVQGGTLTSNSSASLVSLTGNSSLTVGNDGLLDIRQCFSCSLPSVSVTGDLLDASGGGALVVGQFGVINIESGTHSLASGSGKAMFNVAGTATTAETDPDASGLTVGTEQPISRTIGCPTCPPTTGALINAFSSATVTTNQAVKIDTALLEASAPLLNLFLLTNSTMTSNSDLVKLVANAKMAIVPSDALVGLNNSTLNVTGSLFNVAGGSFLKVTGNLFSLDNNSALNITNGALVTVAGGSVFKLTGGSLGLFGATGTNTLTITNPSLVCGTCVSLGGSSFQALLVNGAMSGNVTSAGFTPFGGAGTVNVNVNGATTGNRPVLVVDGMTSKVKLGP